MTQDEKRVKIAESQGWKSFQHERGDGQMETRWTKNGRYNTDGPPSYFASCDAALTLCDSLAKMGMYIEANGIGSKNVQVVINIGGGSPYIHATAPALAEAICEAYLKVKNIQ